jgi:glycosyltransferase involved in cell wall biosynthesis
MNVVIALEHRFTRTPDGAIWTQTMFPYSFWQRYLAVFEGVRVVSRVLDVEVVDPSWKRADGAGVTFARVPHYIGPWQYLWKARQVRRVARTAVGKEDAVILRLGSNIASQITPLLQQTHHPYGVEVVNDPYDVFAPGAVQHPLRPFFRWWFTRQQQQQCAQACAAAYVTEYSLQRRYPPAPDAFSTHYSSVELPDTAFVEMARPLHHNKHSFKLITVGTLAQLYKAPDVLIDAIALCVQSGLDLHLTLVGDGMYRPRLEAQAAQLGLSERIQFCGELPAGEAVRSQLDQADLFVLPSRQEGLPRAMIEAMARGLPCLGSTVGGIPELLPPENLVPPGNVQALANKIREIVTDPARLAQMSHHHLHQAQHYREGILQQRRVAFYQHLRDATEAWITDRSRKGLSTLLKIGVCVE